MSEAIPSFAESPEAAFFLAAAVPHEDLGHILFNYIAAVRDFVSVCAEPDEEDTREFHAEINYTYVILGRLFQQIGMNIPAQ